jgi:hypothetical protein
MNLTMSSLIPRSRMVFKVLVLGRDLPLQTGFLNQVSGERVTNQLYRTLGVSIGIARNDDQSEMSIKLQLWSLPLDERLSGITKTFTKGYRGVIAITRPEEIDSIRTLLQEFNVDPSQNLVIVIVGNVHGIEEDIAARIPFDEKFLDIHSAATAEDVTDIMIHQLLTREKSHEDRISVVFLDESQCPLYEPREPIGKEPACSEYEVEELRSLLISQGIRVIEDSCLVELTEGTASICLRTGAVRLNPEICKYCRHECKRNTNICIIAVDSGWSTNDVGQRALLTAAKILALVNRELPNHVEMQIQRACRCSQFEVNPDQLDQLPTNLTEPHLRNAYLRKTLLEVATDRLKEGRLTKNAYNILKRKLVSVQKSADL